MTTINFNVFPTTIGDMNEFAVIVDLDKDYGGSWLFGKCAYVIGSVLVGEYELGTSLRDLLLQMHLVLSDAGTRITPRFKGLTKDELFSTVSMELYGNMATGMEQLAIEECWAKHNITIPVDVFDGVRVFQFDEGNESRIIWQLTAALGDIEVHEVRLPLRTTEIAFQRLFELLNGLLIAEEEKYQ